MAEGWTNHLGKNWIEARSAGIEVHEVSSRAVAAMREVGIDIAHQKSKLLNPEIVSWADLIVTVCGYVDRVCPALPAGVRKRHWPLFDPSRLEGGEEDVMLIHRALRDHIGSLVRGLVKDVTTGEAPVQT
jgi:arsenate reductase